jgi:hypothetical protein
MLDWDWNKQDDLDDELNQDDLVVLDELETKISAVILDTTGICQACGHEQHIEDDADADVQCEDCQEHEVCGVAAITT